MSKNILAASLQCISRSAKIRWTTWNVLFFTCLKFQFTAHTKLAFILNDLCYFHWNFVKKISIIKFSRLFINTETVTLPSDFPLNRLIDLEKWSILNSRADWESPFLQIFTGRSTEFFSNRELQLCSYRQTFRLTFSHITRKYIK